MKIRVNALGEKYTFFNLIFAVTIWDEASDSPQRVRERIAAINEFVREMKMGPAIKEKTLMKPEYIHMWHPEFDDLRNDRFFKFSLSMMLDIAE